MVQRAFEAALQGRAPPAEFRGTLWLPTQCPEKKKPFEAYWEAATAEPVCRPQ